MDMEMLEEVLFASVAWMDTPTLIASIILCLFSAFFSFRFLKLALVISAFYAGYTFGAETVGLGLKDLVPGFDISIIIGILCAIVFALIAVKIYKYFIYFFGGYIGFVIGLIATMLIFGFEGPGLIVGLVLSVVLAIFFAKLFYGKLFKPFYIACASFGGMVNAAIYTALIFSKDLEAMLLAMLVGFALGLPAMICQFRICKDVNTDDVL